MCRKNAEMDPIGNRKLPARNCPAGVPLFGTDSTRTRTSRLSRTCKAAVANLIGSALMLSRGIGVVDDESALAEQRPPQDHVHVPFGTGVGCCQIDEGSSRLAEGATE